MDSKQSLAAVSRVGGRGKLKAGLAIGCLMIVFALGYVDVLARQRLMNKLGYQGPERSWFSGYFGTRVTKGLTWESVRERVEHFDKVEYYVVPFGSGDSAIVERFIYRPFITQFHVNVYYRDGRVADVDKDDYGMSSRRKITGSLATEILMKHS